jgi:hypothetical protein
MKLTLRERRLICEALNRLFWKCPIPPHLRTKRQETDQNDWARFWLAELSQGPDGQRLTGIRWDEVNSTFKPCRTR